MMRADTQTISINAPRDEVLAYLQAPGNLPRWAVGFAKTVRRDGEEWSVETGAGAMHLRVQADPRTGVVDFHMTPAPGVEVVAASRVIARGSGSEYVFTQFQAPGMSDDAFAKSVQTLRHELTVLKALLEVECPL
ncbi:MAG TPA: SRPBCC family protein [Vicinamibacterales bacterium]|nr:SRPBCC family protein [Vicinamibacterales bacterium]